MEKRNLEIVLLVSIFLFIVWGMLLFSPRITAQIYNETSVLNTTVNITNAAPLVTQVDLPTTINLVGYGNTSVQCNASVTDYDNNTASLNATLHYYLNSSGDADDNNEHYTNSSCSPATPFDFQMDFICTFDVEFYANNGTWYCNASAYDSEGATSSNISNAGTVNPLIAVSIPGVLDFGNIIFNNISDDKLANITNAGNRNINISVEGYAETLGDGLGMVCTNGTIPLGQIRYNATPGTNDWNVMTQLSNDTTMIHNNFFIEQRQDEYTDGNSTNSTYWKIRIPLGAGGVCNGKILFTASDSIA